jgi:hypothetical protein
MQRHAGFGCLLAILLLLGSIQVRAADPSLRRPGHYVVWASVDKQVCQSAVDLVNGLPHQDVARASDAKMSGFLQWQSGPRIEDEPYPWGGRSYFALDHLVLGADGGSTKKYILRWTGMLSNAPTQSVYALDSLPSTREEVKSIITSQPPTFGDTSSQRIVELQRTRGDAWQDWYIGGQVLVSAYGVDPTIFFASHTAHDLTKSTSMLVFTIDPNGVREEKCMLRRICGCAKICRAPSFRQREEAELIPSARFCQGKRTSSATR